MTPQDLLSALLDINDEQGRLLLRAHIPALSEVALDRLVYLLKKETDRQWHTAVQRSFKLSGYLLLIGELTRQKQYYALGLMARGDALRRMDRDQEALPFFDAAGEEFLALGDEVGWARTRIGRISACLRLNRTTEALRDAARAREIFARHGKLLRAGQVDVNAAIINFELGQYDQAVKLFDRAIETYLLLGEGVELHIARARGNKALTLAAQGKFREAVALHEQASATFVQFGEREEISLAREELNIADIYSAQGYYSQALSLYNQSRTLFQKHAMTFAAAEVALQICLCLLRLNRNEEAGELARETVDFFRGVPGQQHNLARSLMHQAGVCTLEGKFRDADVLLREASDLLEEGGFVRLAALARLRRAELYFADRQLEASLLQARYVADVFAEQEDLPHLARATLLLAYLADARGDATTAHEYCDYALDIAISQELLDLQYSCYDLLGQLAERQGDLVVAAAYYDQAVRGIDEVQSRLILDERTSFLEDKGGMYQRAILLALKRKKTDQALSYIEKSKSRVLGDYLRNNIDIRVRFADKTGEDMLEELARLREEQAWYSSIVYKTENEANLSDTALMRIRAIDPVRARKEMHLREHRIGHLLREMQLHSIKESGTRQRAYGTTEHTLSWLAKLEPGTLMLEYYLTDQDIYIFDITGAGVLTHCVQGAVPRLERLISLWRANLNVLSQASTMMSTESWQGLQENALGLLQKLYDLLLRPVANKLHAHEHLVVIPYGILHYLPFHCLFDGIKFAIEQVAISYLPAIALLDICCQRGERIRTMGMNVQDALVLGLSDNGRLPYAVKEAWMVAQQLGSGCALEEAATAALLWRASAHSPLVHIAAHGLFRLDAPDFSYIQLADRQLSAVEVFNLDLSACSLVTLSACETGRAVVGGIDEVIGLGRGFLYAGAASLLPTLWKVDDASSAELMATFYQELLNGATKADALAYAQRAFLAQARRSPNSYRCHPYFWAAFHLIGDAGSLLA